MSDKPPNPHDRFVRDLFSNIPMAQELLRASLPRELLLELDLNGLELVDGALFDEELAEKRLDLLFKIPYLKLKDAFVYVPFEHKSTLQKALRQIHNYSDLLYTKSRYGIPVISYIFYHGKRSWPYFSRFEKLFTKYGGVIRKYASQQEYVFFDLYDKDIDILKISLTMKACLYTLKHIRGENFREKIPELLEIFKGIAFDEENTIIIGRLVEYIYQASDIDIREYQEYMRATGQEVEIIMISTYEQILKEGELKGELKGSLNAARNALRIGLSLEKALEISGLSLEDLRDAGLIDK